MGVESPIRIMPSRRFFGRTFIFGFNSLSSLASLTKFIWIFAYPSEPRCLLNVL